MNSHFRIEIKTLSKSSGQSAAAVHQYDDRVRHNDKSDLVSSGRVNMPGWAHDVSKFWAAADRHERTNGMVCRRSIMSFPNQLPGAERENYVREWLGKNCPDMPASWVVQDDSEADPRNAHVHILISERQVDGIERSPELFFRRYNAKNPEFGGCKKADIGSNRKDWLTLARSSWADILNAHLPADQQVDHRSNAEYGLPPPQPKFGHKVIAAEKNGIRTKLVSSIVENAATTNKIRCLSFVDATGRTVTYRAGIDKGDSIEIVGKLSRNKVIDLVRACYEKDWAEVDLFGTDEFKQLACIELVLAGIKIKGENNEQDQSNNSNQNQRGSERNSEERRADRTGRPTQTGADDEPDRRLGQGRERPQQQANRDVAQPAGTAHFDGREADSLDELDDSRQADIHTISSSCKSAASPASTGLHGSKRRNDMQNDLTFVAVQKQLAAMNSAQEFEIGILNQKTGKMMISKVGAGQILEQVARLKRENARGNNIYVRPDRDSAHPYLLMDDLSQQQLDELTREGFSFSLLLETSPNNHQLLIKLPQPLVAAERKQIERALQKRFGSDPGSADGQHFFRLGGFTNRKPKHEKGGRFPYVLVKQANQSPLLTTAALEWLTIAPKVIDVPDDQPELLIEKIAVRPEWSDRRGELAEVVAKSHQYLSVRYAAAYDPSIADFQVAKTLIKQGWNSDSVREGLRDGSPDLCARKVGHVDDYLNRTLSKVTGRPVGSSPADADIRPDPNNPYRNPQPRP